MVAPLSLGATLALLKKEKAEKDALEKVGPPLSVGETLLKLKKEKAEKAEKEALERISPNKYGDSPSKKRKDTIMMDDEQCDHNLSGSPSKLRNSP